MMTEPRFHPIAIRVGANSPLDASSVAYNERRTYGTLLRRIEQLARELGRSEGHRSALEHQIARLEQQMSALRGSAQVEA